MAAENVNLLQTLMPDLLTIQQTYNRHMAAIISGLGYPPGNNNEPVPQQASLDGLHLDWRKPTIVCGLGFGGSGKDTVLQDLGTQLPTAKVLNATTREVRYKNGVPIEKEGADYNFITEAQYATTLGNPTRELIERLGLPPNTSMRACMEVIKEASDTQAIPFYFPLEDRSNILTATYKPSRGFYLTPRASVDAAIASGKIGIAIEHPNSLLHILQLGDINGILAMIVAPGDKPVITAAQRAFNRNSNLTRNDLLSTVGQSQLRILEELEALIAEGLVRRDQIAFLINDTMTQGITDASVRLATVLREKLRLDH